MTPECVGELRRYVRLVSSHNVRCCSGNIPPIQSDGNTPHGRESAAVDPAQGMWFITAETTLKSPGLQLGTKAADVTSGSEMQRSPFVVLYVELRCAVWSPL